MKILFITYFFAPYNCIGAVRTSRTAELLLKRGHDVKVISADKQNLKPNLASDFSEKNIYRTKWIDLERPIYFFGGKNRIQSINSSLHKGSIKGRVLSLLKRSFHRIISIPDKHIGWQPYAVKQAKKLISSGWIPDVIYASATPYSSLVIAKKISSYFGIPWVGELRDLWSDNHYGYGWWIDKKMEESVLKKASALITVSEPLKKILQEKYPQIPSYSVLNGYDDKDFETNFESDTKKSINIVHTGAVYEGKRDPTPLFEALISNKKLRKIVQIDFFGSNLGFINSLINKFQLYKCVKTYSEISRNESLRRQKNAQILLLLTWNNSKERGVLPGKLFEYIGSGVPILSIGAIENEASKLIEKNNFGVATNNKEKIAKFIQSILDNDFQFNFKGRNKFERNAQINVLEKILKDASKV